MSFLKLYLEMIHDPSHYHEIPLELKKLLYQKEITQDSWLSQKLSFKILFEAHWLQMLCNSLLYLEGAFVDTKNVTLPLHILSTSRSYMKPHPTTTSNATSSIRSCQNQTKSTRSFKTTIKRVHTKFWAISTSFCLTSLFQQQNRCSRWQWSWRPWFTKQSTQLASKYH